MEKTIRLKLILGAACLSAFLMFWPGGWASPETGLDFRVQLPTEPASLDFSLVEDGVSFRVLDGLMSGLVRYDQHYYLEMVMAEKMEILDNGKRYRFTLKPWKWSDGKPVVPEDFVYALSRTLEPSSHSKLADLLFHIKGAEAYKKGLNKNFDSVGVKVIASNVLEFQLETAVKFFPQILTLPIGYPQRKDIVDNFGAQWPERMVTTGPYKLVRWQHDQKVELEQNTYFPNFDSKAPKRVQFQIIPEEATAANLFENGRLDVLFKVPIFEIERFRKKKTIQEFPFFATYYVAFDQRKTGAPWKDRLARLAVAQAINRKAIIAAMGSTDSEAGGWIPKGLPGFNTTIGIKYDPVAAKANWKKSAGNRVKQILIGYDTSARNQVAMERLQEDLKTTLGVKVVLQNRDWKTYLRELTSNTPPMYRFGWLSPFVDSYSTLVAFQSTNPNNYTGWKDARYDALLKKIAAIPQQEPERQAFIDQAQKILLEEAVAAVPIFHYNQVLVVAPRVKNLFVNGVGLVDFLKVRLD